MLSRAKNDALQLTADNNDMKGQRRRLRQDSAICLLIGRWTQATCRETTFSRNCLRISLAGVSVVRLPDATPPLQHNMSVSQRRRD